MTAVDFEFEATPGVSGKLSDFLGQHVVLYFYPKDNTPGCTMESQDFTELYNEFQGKNTVILGISKDSLRTHENFKAKYQMPFELISDPQATLCQQFEVYKEKSMFGKKYKGIERSTFIIDPNGQIMKSWRKVKVKGHAHTVLNSIP